MGPVLRYTLENPVEYLIDNVAQVGVNLPRDCPLEDPPEYFVSGCSSMAVVVEATPIVGPAISADDLVGQLKMPVLPAVFSMEDPIDYDENRAPQAPLLVAK